MFLSPQNPFYCGVHELSNATVKFSPQEHYVGGNTGFSVHQEGTSSPLLGP